MSKPGYATWEGAQEDMARQRREESLKNAALEFIRNLECECDAYQGYTCARCKFLDGQPMTRSPNKPVGRPAPDAGVIERAREHLSKWGRDQDVSSINMLSALIYAEAERRATPTPAGSGGDETTTDRNSNREVSGVGSSHSSPEIFDGSGPVVGDKTGQAIKSGGWMFLKLMGACQ